jgi:low affinity Fe/Cu permease
VANTVVESDTAHMPSDVSGRLGVFDRFATVASTFFSRAWFFALCVLLVVVWAPSYFVIGSLDTWQLIINTATTIVTFMMVALLQNSQTRADAAVQDKLNAIAAALAELMEAHSADSQDLQDATDELRHAVGLEDRESS